MIIVTGGAGFIGSHLCTYLLGWNKYVTCVDDLRASVMTAEDLRLYQMENPRFKYWRVADVTMQPLIKPTDKVEAIFHLASPVGPVGVLEEAGDIARQIVNGVITVARIATQRKARLVYVSTSEIYGADGLCSETMPAIFQPPSSARKEYAIGKLAAETILRGWEDLDVVIVRPFNVAGPRQNASKGFVIPRFVQQALDGEPLTVFGDGSDQRSFTHVQDIVEGLWKAFTSGENGEIYNLGNPVNRVTIAELATWVAEHPVSNNGGQVQFVDPAALFPGYARSPDKWPDNTKTFNGIGWLPHRSIDEIIDDAFHWEVVRRGMKS